MKVKDTQFSRYENVGRLIIRLSGELFEEVDCFKCLRRYMAANEGIEIKQVRDIKFEAH